MSEHYEIISPARGEPRPAGCVGVRIRAQLSGYPSRRWSHVLAGRLVRELTGHAAVGHLRINVDDIVQGDEIVLEGVEPREAPALAEPLLQAVNAANRATTEEQDPPRNVAQPVADAIAGQVLPTPIVAGASPKTQTPNAASSIATIDNQQGDLPGLRHT